jgi:PadR family transcriptional regulator PadR
MGEGRIRGQLLKGTTPLLILSVLRDGELYGYQIAQRIREKSGGTFDPGEGSLYPALHVLESEGALQAKWADSDKGPRRRYYQITPAGQKLLAAHEAEWATFSAAMTGVTGTSHG